MLKLPGRLAFQFGTNRLWSFLLTGLLERTVVNVYWTEAGVRIIINEGRVSDSHTCFPVLLNSGGCCVKLGVRKFRKETREIKLTKLFDVLISSICKERHLQFNWGVINFFSGILHPAQTLTVSKCVCTDFGEKGIQRLERKLQLKIIHLLEDCLLVCMWGHCTSVNKYQHSEGSASTIFWLENISTLILYSDDGDSRFVRNVCIFPPDVTVSHFVRPKY
jgi:hypothetical protein